VDFLNDTGTLVFDAIEVSLDETTRTTTVLGEQNKSSLHS
jgi:hypothetical protein